MSVRGFEAWMTSASEKGEGPARLTTLAELKRLLGDQRTMIVDTGKATLKLRLRHLNGNTETITIIEKGDLYENQHDGE